MIEKPKSAYIFVIDTETYAGNFERETCAYATGQVGHCGVGEEEAAQFEDEAMKEKIGDIIRFENDEHGCARPASIWPTPGWFNNGVGGHFKPGQEAEALEHYKAYMRKERGDSIKSLQENNLKELEAGRPYANWTIPAVHKQIAEYRKEIEKAEALTKPQKYDAYNSVAIFFDKKPTAEMIEVMKQRAQDFADGKGKWRMDDFRKTPHRFKITGFRLLKRTTAYEEVKIC